MGLVVKGGKESISQLDAKHLAIDPCKGCEGENQLWQNQLNGLLR
jgi:hypothetical protein